MTSILDNSYIGIDNGKNGGIVVINDNGILFKCVMPIIGKEYDVQKIAKIIGTFQPKLVVLEAIFCMPTIPRRTAQSLGWCLGFMEGICSSLQIPYTVVHPKTWQKALFKNMTGETKQKSISYITKMFPKEDWRATERSKKIHDGMTDAACLALYGKRL